MQVNNQVFQESTTKYYLKESIFWIYHFFLILYGIIIISLLASASTELQKLRDSDAYGLAQTMIQQWKTNYILDITVSASGGDCPSGYTSLINYNWPGSMAGCACPFNSDNTRQIIIVKGRCSTELLQYNCYDVDPKEAKVMQNWRDEKKICVKRDSEQSFYNNIDDICASQVVPDGYKKCGSGSRSVCRKSNDLCPITDIVNSLNLVDQSGSDSITLGTVTYYFNTETVGELPVQDFRLDEYAHCADPAQNNISPSKKGEYVLLKEKRVNCDETEYRTKELDEYGEEDFFLENTDVYNIVTQELPAYPRPSNDFTFKLAYQNYPLWTYQCRSDKNLKLSELGDRLTLKDEENNETHLLATTVISVSFVSLILIIIESRRKFQRKAEWARIKQVKADDQNYKAFLKFIPQLHQNWIKTTYSLIIVDRIFKFINIISIFICYTELRQAKNFYSSVSTQRCGDDYYIERIQERYEQGSDEIFNFYGAMLGLWWVVFALDWIYLAFRYFHEIRPTLDELEGKNRRVIPQKQGSYDEDDDDDIDFAKQRAIANGKKEKVDIFDQEEEIVQDIDNQNNTSKIGEKGGLVQNKAIIP